jgi:CRISPR-associated endoribonuclease Cas6
MLRVTARTPTRDLPVGRVLSRLFQSFVYHHLPPAEHAGFTHSSGKLFKSTNFRIDYKEEKIEIAFRALRKEYEQQLAMAILKEGMRLGAIHISDVRVGLIEESEPQERMVATGYVCAALKNRLTGKKIFLEPADPRHTRIVTNNALQKYETFFGRSPKKLAIEPVWQSPRPKTFWYEKTPYVAWEAKYRIDSEPGMCRLLRDTGLGSDTMKGLGFLEVADG